MSDEERRVPKGICLHCYGEGEVFGADLKKKTCSGCLGSGKTPEREKIKFPFENGEDLG